MPIWLELASLVSPTILLCAAGGYWWRKKIKPSITDLMVALVEQRLANAIITKELTPNGGGSIKDLVSQIRPNHRAAQEHWEKIETRLTAMDGQMATNASRLSAIEDGNHRAGQILDVAFRYAPIEQQKAVEEFMKTLPPPERKP